MIPFDNMINRVAIFFCMCVVFAASCSERQEPIPFPWDELREGDLAFRCGRGLFSRMVTAAGKDGLYSHVGLMVKVGDRWKVVHAVPAEPDFKGDFDRVKMDDLTVFFGPERAIRGCMVHTGLADTESVRSICMDAINLAQDSIRFDNDYDLQDSTRLYCSELVWFLYNKKGIDLSEGRRRYINIIGINNDVILPEHIYAYSNNNQYFNF